MAQVFISYRRQESAHAAGRIHYRLIQQLVHHRIFMDTDSIEPGVDFRKRIDAAISSSKVVVALIGPGWLQATDGKGARRLDSPNDPIRLEIAAALQRDLRVIPLLLDGASMPAEEDLPMDIRGLADRNGIEIRHPRFDSDVGHLVEVLERILDEKPEPIQEPSSRLQPEPSASAPVAEPKLESGSPPTVPLAPSSEVSPAAPTTRRRWLRPFLAATTAAMVLAIWYGRASRNDSEEQAGLLADPTDERKDSAQAGPPSPPNQEELAAAAPDTAGAHSQVDGGGGHGKRPRPRSPQLSAGQDAVEASLAPNKPEIAKCYKLVENDPKLIGEVGVEIWVDARGKVQKVILIKTESPLNSNQVRECIRKEVRRLTFPQESHRPIRVKHIFRFPDSSRTLD